jgi:hypothetical protein
LNEDIVVSMVLVKELTLIPAGMVGLPGCEDEEVAEVLPQAATTRAPTATRLSRPARWPRVLSKDILDFPPRRISQA